tara:strand:+ start:629 stop:1267 length:639 start_codon:yes stop_codon:yes gene_type:complete
MTKLLINKIKDDLNAEQSNASKQGIQVKKQFNILDEQLGPNLESMANFFGNVDGIDKFNLDYFNPFKKEGFIGREGHGATDKHNIMQSIDGRITIEKPSDNNSEEYKLYKQYDFQKTHSKSQYSWYILWGFILLILLAIKMYYFVSTFLFGKTNDSSSSSESDDSPESSAESSPEPSPVTSPKSEEPKSEEPKSDDPKSEEPKSDDPKSDAS